MTSERRLERVLAESQNQQQQLQEELSQQLSHTLSSVLTNRMDKVLREEMKKTVPQSESAHTLTKHMPLRRSATEQSFTVLAPSGLRNNTHPHLLQNYDVIAPFDLPVADKEAFKYESKQSVQSAYSAHCCFPSAVIDFSSLVFPPPT